MKPSTRICIEKKPFWCTNQSVGQLIQCQDPSALEDLIISIADEIADTTSAKSDFDPVCFRFVDAVAVGKAIVDRIRALPSDWDGGSWTTLTLDENDPEKVDRVGKVSVLPLKEIARTRLKIGVKCDEATMLRLLLTALIQAV